jgi:hypothetical protein
MFEELELKADRCDLSNNAKALRRVTLSALVERYRDTVTINKRGRDVEGIVLTAFFRHSSAANTSLTIGPEDFASYRDERLKSIRLQR